ncbi:MAG: hypothetical protein QOG86_3 [Thermoleophilaceae bacterium]|nr:hypothetical protein [Thermoleophilaceae bacterium]
MDPPPDPGGRHVHACRACGSPIHEDQAACLSCGAMVERGDSRAGIRRAALGSATALLVLGGAVGAAVAGLPHGKHVPKAAIAHVFGKKAPPPATADPNATANGDTTLPGAGTGTATPPAIHPSSPHNTKTPSSPSTGSSSPSGSSSGSGGSPSGGTPSKKHHAKQQKKDPPPKEPKHSGPTLFSGGVAPADAGVFDSSGAHQGAGKSYNTIDSDRDSAWTTGHDGTGIYVTPNSGQTKALGIVSETDGYDASIYFSRASNPPANLADWRPAGGVTNAGAKEKVALSGDARKGKYFLVRVTGFPVGKTRVSLNEIQLFQ